MNEPAMRDAIFAGRFRRRFQAELTVCGFGIVRHHEMFAQLAVLVQHFSVVAHEKLITLGGKLELILNTVRNYDEKDEGNR